MTNAKEKWIQWCCRKFTGIYRRIRDRLLKARPDLKLYLYMGEPFPTTAQAGELDGHYDDQSFMKRVLKRFGFDVDKLRKEHGIVVSFVYAAAGSGPAPTEHLGWRELQTNQLRQNLFPNDSRGGAFIMAHFPHYGAFYFPRGNWLFETSRTRQGYFLSTYPAESFLNVMVRSNPSWLGHTIMDVCECMGRIHEKRVFARAYRSLPNARYRRLTGHGLDRNIWISRARQEGKEYFYAANLGWWKTYITLNFARGAKIYDLIRGRQAQLNQGRWSFDLGPYQLQTFRVKRGRLALGRSLLSADAEIDPLARTFIISTIDNAIRENTNVVQSARRREKELRELPGWAGVAYLERQLAKIRRLKEASDIAGAYSVAVNGGVVQARQKLVNEALQAIPFLVLGPFGKPEDTQGAGKITANPEVVSTYRGMETPFIGESDEPEPRRLKIGLKPDLRKTYIVYPDRKAKWRKAWKTRFLSFYGKCHSEHPLWMVAYAYTEVFSPKDVDATIWVGSDHAIWGWVNDDRVIKHGGYRTPRGGQRPSVPDQNRGNCHLKRGWNRILIKAVQRGPTRIYFRIADSKGNTLGDLRFTVPEGGSHKPNPSPG